MELSNCRNWFTTRWTFCRQRATVEFSFLRRMKVVSVPGRLGLGCFFVSRMPASRHLTMSSRRASLSSPKTWPVDISCIRVRNGTCTQPRASITVSDRMIRERVAWSRDGGPSARSTREPLLSPTDWGTTPWSESICWMLTSSATRAERRLLIEPSTPQTTTRFFSCWRRRMTWTKSPSPVTRMKVSASRPGTRMNS